jgi:hypothetical protein
LFDDYCRNKTYTVSIDNQKLVKIHGMMWIQKSLIRKNQTFIFV